ncbi:kinesin-like protein KIF6 [Pyxicephalus adspersus]|uniref:kinesin-like protein KIF6 n=1 Tax=Pyxicephalus adspersus TaxID=30357 RepID=UPI003B5A4F71
MADKAEIPELLITTSKHMKEKCMGSASEKKMRLTVVSTGDAFHTAKSASSDQGTINCIFTHYIQIYSLNHDESGASSLEITVPRDLADGFVNNKRETYKFRFQETFDQDAKQEGIFESIAKPVAESVLTGYNGTIFAYGQTGSGKTFTITGGAERYSDRGIIPRTLSYIFEQFQKDSSKVYTIHISYLEIYNECGYDLLDPRHEASKLEDLPKVTIMEDPDQNIHLKNLSFHQANSEEEALNLLFLGDTNRMIAETPMNQASTRSHCIFTMHISSKEPGSATVRRSKLHLVDLAGSERVAKTGVGGQLLTEAKYINLSLHYLEQVIIALAERNRSHIPYRNSMMTSVLRDSLGGNCMTTMIATLSMEKRNIDESISTCRFAQRVALIKNEALLNEEIDPQLMIVRLKKEIQALKDELALVTGEQRTDDLTQEETLRLDEQIHNFLEDGDPESSLDIGADMRKIHYCFALLKRLFRDKKQSDIRISSPETTRERLGFSDARPEEIKKLRDLLQQRDNEINILVSMLKKEKKRTQDAMYEMSQSSGQLPSQNGAGLSGSPAWKGPPTPTASSYQQVRESMAMESRPAAFHRRTGEKMSLGRQEAFEIFKRDYPDRVGIEDNKALLKQRFAEAKSLGEEVNNVRNRINHLKAEVEKRRMQRAALGVSSSSDELNEHDPAEDELRGQMEDEKKRYKSLFNRLKSLKTEIEHLQLLLEKAKVKLLKDFEEWWSEEASDLQIIPGIVDKVLLRTQSRVDKREPLSSLHAVCQHRNIFISSFPHGRAHSLNSLSAKASRSFTLKTPQWSIHLADVSSDNTRSLVNSTASSLQRPASSQRAPRSANTPIPLTGDSQTDADILAFVRARQNLLQRKGKNDEQKQHMVLLLS